MSTRPAEFTYAHAPGKIILSGEHSVVYGGPAIAAALARYTEVCFKPVHRSNALRTAFEDLSQGQFYPLRLLSDFKQGLDRRFDQFIKGELPVQQILQRPDDLVVYTLASLAQRLPLPGATTNTRLPMPGQLSSRSDLPLGSGMGSSAAVIAATFVLYERLLNHPQTDAERFERVRFCERLQHGKGGAIDAATVVYGGINQVQGDAITKPALDPGHGLWNGTGWYWVLQGVPTSSTGECVAQVRQTHGGDSALWQGFADCTNALLDALTNDADPRPVIKENHRLLSRIGVVPATVNRMVDMVEAAGGAAKISGAGSIRGDHGGVVLVHMPDPKAMAALMTHYPGRQWGVLSIAEQGASLGPAPNPGATMVPGGDA